jgi:hypothetical protein
VLASAGPQRALGAAGLGAEPLARTPVAGWELATLHRLSTRADATGAVAGLPREWAGPVVDGAPISLARHPTVTGLAPGSWSFPAAAVETAEMAAAPAAGHIPGVRLHTRRGAVRWGGRAAATGLALSPGGEGGDAGRAAFTVGGPMLSDSAHLTLSAQLERREQPVAAFWPAGDEGAAWQVAALERYDRDLAAYLEPGAATATSGSLFGRFDWKIAAEHLLSVHGAFSRQNRDGWAEEWAAGDLLGLSTGATDAFAGVRLTSLLTDALSQETGVTVTRSARAFAPRSPTGTDAILPATGLMESGARIGRAGVETGDFERTAVRVESGLAYRWADHTFRGGVALDLDGFRDRYDERTGEFASADVERFREGVGAFAGQRLDTREVRYTSPRLGAWIGDSWLVREGLELEATVRFDAQRLPADEVRTDATWGRYTGLDNAAASRHADPCIPLRLALLGRGRPGADGAPGGRRPLQRATGPGGHGAMGPGEPRGAERAGRRRRRGVAGRGGSGRGDPSHPPGRVGAATPDGAGRRRVDAAAPRRARADGGGDGAGDGVPPPLDRPQRDPHARRRTTSTGAPSSAASRRGWGCRSPSRAPAAGSTTTTW